MSLPNASSVSDSLPAAGGGGDGGDSGATPVAVSASITSAPSTISQQSFKLSLFHPSSAAIKDDNNFVRSQPQSPMRATTTAIQEQLEHSHQHQHDELSDSNNNNNSNRDPNGSNSKSSGRWTLEEHRKFIEGIKLFNRNWKKVEEHIGTRTGAQIRSHAQKFFNKLEKDQLQQQQQQQQKNSGSSNINNSNNAGGSSIGLTTPNHANNTIPPPNAASAAIATGKTTPNTTTSPLQQQQTPALPHSPYSQRQTIEDLRQMNYPLQSRPFEDFQTTTNYGDLQQNQTPNGSSAFANNSSSQQLRMLYEKALLSSPQNSRQFAVRMGNPEAQDITNRHLFADDKDSDEIVEKYTRQIQENSVQDNSFFIEHHLADISEPRLYDMCAVAPNDQLNYKSEVYVPNNTVKKAGGRSRFGSFKLHDEENEVSNQRYQKLRKASIDDQELKKKFKLNDSSAVYKPQAESHANTLDSL